MALHLLRHLIGFDFRAQRLVIAAWSAALLIEAVKEQQRQALAKDRKIARLTTQVHQLHKLNGQLALLQSRMERLEQERATTLTATSRPMCNGARN